MQTIKIIWKIIAPIVVIALVIPLFQMVEAKGDVTMLNTGASIDGVVFLLPVDKNTQSMDADYEEDGGFGGRFFARKDGSLSVVYSGYPDVGDDWKLTKVRILDPPHSIFDLSVETPIETVTEVMDQKNYDLRIIGSKYYYNKGDIEIIFRRDYDATVSSITIEMKATNKDEIDF